MPSTEGVVTYTTLAPGVTRFSWYDTRGCGDGLLVDVHRASLRWRDVADVLLCIAPACPIRRPGRIEGPYVVLAEVAQGTAGSFIVDIYSIAVSAALSAGPQYPELTQVIAEDWAAVSTTLVDHYRAVLAGRHIDPRR